MDQHIGAALERARGAVFVCELSPLMRAFEAVAVVARAGTVLLEATGDAMTVTGHDGRNAISVVVPVRQAFRSLLVDYDALIRPLRAVANERRESFTDRRLVAITADDRVRPVLEVDGLTVHGLSASDEGFPREEPAARPRVTVARDTFVAAVPPHLGDKPEPEWWRNHLTVDVSDGQLIVGARSRLATIVTTVAAQTRDIWPLGDTLDLSASVVSHAARWWKADTLEIGWNVGYRGSYRVALRCGDLTVQTDSVSGDGRTRGHMMLATGPPPVADAVLGHEVLCAVVERRLDAIEGTRNTNVEVMLTQFSDDSFAVIPVLDGQPSFEDGEVVDANVRNPKDAGALLLPTRRLLHALEQLDSTVVELQLPDPGDPLVLSSDYKGPPRARRVVIDQSVF